MGELPPYDAIAEEFSAARRTLSAPETECLQAFLEALPPSAAVLDLGCGSGTPIAQLVAARGHAVTGVDGSPALLAKAQAALPEHRWVRGKLAEVVLPEQFDGVICWDALFHSPRAEWPGVIARVHGWLRPGGYFLLSSGGEVGAEGFTDTMFGHTFYYDSLTPEDLRRVLEQTGFAIQRTVWCNVPDGVRDRGRLGTLAQKVR